MSDKSKGHWEPSLITFSVVLVIAAVMCIITSISISGRPNTDRYDKGLKKGLTDGRELGQGEPKIAEGGVEYTAVYCEPTFPHEQVCLVKHIGTMGSIQFIQVPVDEPAIKPGQKFRVSYSSGGYIYFTRE